MADTKDFGRLFVYSIKIIPGTPLVHFAPTYEISEPFREAQSLVVRLGPLRRALVIGWWKDTGRNEEEALSVALQSHGIDVYEGGPDLDDPDVRATIRENIAASASDLDEEWEIISALGVAK